MSNYSHGHLERHFVARGYHLRRPGVCGGLAQMAIQAFLAGHEELMRFNKRLDLIATSTPMELSSRIRTAREAIAARSRKIRFDSKLAENDSVLLDLTEEEELLTETEAFFDGVELYLRPLRHKDLFSKLVSHPQIAEIIPYLESTSLVEQGGMRVADSFPALYSLRELQDYLNRLTQILLYSCPPCDVAMGLDNMNHRISILFDSARGLWVLCDANSLPLREITTGAELSVAVFTALALNTGEGRAATLAAIHTTVYTTKKNEPHAKKIMEAVKKSAEFTSAHEVTLRKVNQRTGVLNVSLASLAARYGHQDLLKLINRIKPGALGEIGHLGDTPLHSAVLVNSPDPVKIFVEEGVSLEARGRNGQSALCQAICFNRVEAVTALLNEQKDLAFTALNDCGWLPIHVAAEKNATDIIRLLAERGVNLRAEHAGGWSPLAITASKGSLEAMQLLLALDPTLNLDKATDEGITPLMAAAREGHVNIVKILVLAKPKIDLNKKDRDGKTALHFAIEKNDLAVVAALISGGANVELEDDDGNTPLHLAAQQNLKPIIDFLIEHHASTRKINRAGKTPFSPGFAAYALLRAAATRDLMLTKIDGLQRQLADQGACQATLRQLKKDMIKSYHYPFFSTHYSSLSPVMGLALVAAQHDNSDALRLLCAEEKRAMHARDSFGLTLLHIAVMNDSRRVVDTLVAARGVLDDEVKATGATAAYLAAEGGFTEILQKIILNASPAILNRANFNHETPLYAAVKQGHAEAAQLLLEAKVDVDREGNTRKSPLHLSIELNHLSIFELLMKKADLNKAVGSFGVTPVALAAEYGRLEILRLLLGKAPVVDIRRKCAEGGTPLMRAIKYGHPAAAKMLIAALEAKDLNEKDKSGMSALHLAIDNNDYELVQALITKSADVNIASGPDNTTAVQRAVMGHQVEIVKLLLKHGADPHKQDRNRQCAVSEGTPLGVALAIKKNLVATIDAWMEELRQAQPGRCLLSEVASEFARLKQLIEADFEAHYESFARRHRKNLFGNKGHLLIAFIAAANGYKNILQLSLAKIDSGAKNPAGLSLVEVAEASHHPELVHILREAEEGRETKREIGLAAVGLFSGRASVPAPAAPPVTPAVTDVAYEQLKAQILQEAMSIEMEIKTQPGFNPARHRRTLKSIEIRKKLAECDKAAATLPDKYHYLKAQCEDKASHLYYALQVKTDSDAKSSDGASKHVLAKIAELEASMASRP